MSRTPQPPRFFIITFLCQVMKLLEAVELRPSRATMDNALDEIDWASITSDNDVFFAVFRAAFR